MNIITDAVIEQIDGKVVRAARKGQLEAAVDHLLQIYSSLQGSDPDKKHIDRESHLFNQLLTRQMGKAFFDILKDLGDGFATAVDIFKTAEVQTEQEAVGSALWAIVFFGVADWQKAVPYLEKAAVSSLEEIRQSAARGLQSVTKENCYDMIDYLEGLARSGNPLLRRLVSESLRPLADGEWINDQPGFSTSILGHMFKEKDLYPRASVADNLSDLAHNWPEMIYGLVEELVESGDENSFWIAHRACRNLVKKEPIRVKTLLKIDEYEPIING